MPGLSKTQAVPHLLRSRGTQSPKSNTSPLQSRSPDSPVPSSNDIVSSPAPLGKEVVPYRGPSQPTATQLERVARADEGDLQSRLDLISIESVERALERRPCRHDPSRTLLSYLRDPGKDVAPYEAASAVLEDLADRTEDAAIDSVLVFRFVQAHGLWKNHPNSKVRSAEDLVGCLARPDFVQALLVMGASVHSSKRSRLALIESKWGASWFQEVPQDMRNPDWYGPEQCSSGLLDVIATSAEAGVSLPTAVEQWRVSMRDRNDFGRRKALKIKGPFRPHLIPSDVIPAQDRKRRRAPPTVDTLRVEVVPPNPPAARPDPSDAEPRPKKKSRVIVEDSDDDDGEEHEEDGWKLSKDGTTRWKRKGRQIIYEPVDKVVNVDAAASQLLVEASQETPPSTLPTPSRSCDGPGIALVMRKFIRVFQDAQLLDVEAAMAHGCCETCRPTILDAMQHLKKVLPHAAALEEVDSHRFRDSPIPPSQIQISPLKPLRSPSPASVPGTPDAES